MTSFAALMALSASQTREAEAQVQSALEERQRREAQKRKQQEEKERKEKEMETKLRLKHLEERKREEERRKRMDAEKQAKEAALRKKEEEQRDALRYGPKKAKTDYPSSSYSSRDQGRRKSSSSDDESGAGGPALTREEKRQMRLQRELNYGLSNGKRSAGGAYRKVGRRLPGGAVDTFTDGGASPGGNYRSTKDRLAHEPPGLIRLNVNKRDTRTIDEIRQDLERKKTKVLMGEDAKGFDNWFGGGKGKGKGASQSQPSRQSSMFSSRSPSPVEDKPALSKPQARGTKSQSRTPPAASRPPAPAQSTGYPSSSSKPQAPPAKGSSISVRSFGKPQDKMPAIPKKAPVPARGAAKPIAKGHVASSGSKPPPPVGAPRKRQRSLSFDSPPPPKRRSLPPENDHLDNDISSAIWKMFGKDRNRIMARDVFSDDEDMEADAMDLFHEEQQRYALIAFMNVLLTQLPCTVLASLARRMSVLSWRRNAMRKRSVGRGRRKSSVKGGADLECPGTSLWRSRYVVPCNDAGSFPQVIRLLSSPVFLRISVQSCIYLS